MIIILVLVLFFGGCKKPEKVFIRARHCPVWSENCNSQYNWYEASVLEKRGDMWKINVEDKTEWVDINEVTIKY